MRKLKRVIFGEATLLTVAIVLLLTAAAATVLYASNSNKNLPSAANLSMRAVSGSNSNAKVSATVKTPAATKTLIIFAEAFPYYVVSKNLDSLPAVKSLCDEGKCFSMQPQSPTFTTMEMYALNYGKKPYEARYAYNFVINKTAFQRNTCAFIGELSNLAKPGQDDLFDDIKSEYSYQHYTVEGYLGQYNMSKDDEGPNPAINVFPKIPDLLEKNDVVYTYVTDTDSHFTNLTVTDGNSPIMKKFVAFDEQLGKLIQNMKDRDLYKNTNIVLFGDHGMMKIDHFDYLPEMLYNISKKADLADVCEWNDAGMSLRFWVLPKAKNKDEIKKAITDYFSTHKECYQVVNETVLKQHDLLMPDPAGRWLNFGDVYIATKPGCTVNTGKPSGGMENGFAVNQRKMDMHISMHGYINNTEPKLQAFVILKSNKDVSVPRNFTVIDLHSMVRQLVLGAN